MTARGLSAAAGLSHGMIGHLERGDVRSMSAVRLAAVARVLGMSLDDLVAEDAPERPHGRRRAPRARRTGAQ